MIIELYFIKKVHLKKWTDITMTKIKTSKRQTMIDKTLFRKQKIEQRTPLKTWMNSCALEM
jgi:hypothetical protein